MRAGRALTLVAALGLAASVAGAAPRQTASARSVSPELFAGYSYAEAGDASLHGLSDWGVALGGGLTYGLNTRWALRALVHLRFVHGEGAWDTDPRLAVGAVFRLGR